MRVVAFPVEVISGVPVVITPEEIDITNAGALRAALLRAGAQGRKTYVVDMTRTRFCDSAGLHALLGAHRRAQAEGGEVRFVVTGPGVRRVLAIMAVDRVIPVFGRLDEALASRSGPACQDNRSGLTAGNYPLALLRSWGRLAFPVGGDSGVVAGGVAGQLAVDALRGS